MKLYMHLVFYLVYQSFYFIERKYLRLKSRIINKSIDLLLKTL
ncbi:hypothetical protein [Flammeovirga yaeyamensis]|nr:hypothetical protein [Flammeovirga yaeyamensis]